MPATEEVLCKFVAQVASEGLRHRTIKSYMAGVRHQHIEEGGDPFLPVKRSQGRNNASSRERLRITPQLLRKIKAAWDGRATNPDFVMLRAACCLAFFGFMRAGE